MSTKKLIKALGLIIVVALLAAALPLQAKAEGETVTVIPVYVLSQAGMQKAEVEFFLPILDQRTMILFRLVIPGFTKAGKPE